MIKQEKLNNKVIGILALAKLKVNPFNILNTNPILELIILLKIIPLTTTSKNNCMAINNKNDSITSKK